MRVVCLLIALAVGALSGCATITSSETQPISVATYGSDGDRVEKVRCMLHNDKGSWQVETPGFAQVHRSSEDLMVECSKEGQPNGFARVISRAAAGMYGNIIFGGGVGAIIDHTKGTGYDYPSSLFVRMGGSVVLDKRDEGSATSVAAVPMSTAAAAPPSPPSVDPAAKVTTVKVAAADPSLPPSLPRPGDRWSYQYIDGYTGRRGDIFVHEVLYAKKGEVDERMYMANRSAFADEQVFTFDALRVLDRTVPGAQRTEFAPYIQAFRPDISFGDIGPVGAALRDADAGWKYRGRVVGREIVVVPAGSFDAIKIDVSGQATSARVAGSRLSAGQVQHLIWYAPKVKRYVRYEINSWNGFGPVDKQRFELIDYTVH